jgi:acetyltransferase-like isoleucine patch superfamily enzyme
MAKPTLVALRDRAARTFRAMRAVWLRKVWGMDLGKEVIISLKANLDKSNPHGIHIGDYSTVTFDAVVLAHDYLNNKHADTRIGKYCYIGARSIIMPGVTIGDHCIVGTASVVMKDVPSNSLVVGNPARVMETGLQTGRYGMRLEAVAPSDMAELPEELQNKALSASVARSN